MVTLNDVLGYGNETDPATGQPRANAQQQAEAVKLWHKDTVDYGRAATADPKNPLSADSFWQGTLAVDDEVTETLDTLRSAAMYNTSQNLFQDPEELASFWRVWESSGKDPENMDAPERWIENARAMDQIGQAAAFQAPRYQSGQIGVGPNILGHYLIREKEDGTGYQSFVQSAFPTNQQIKQADGTTKTVEALPPPITVDLPSLEAMRQQANERLAEADRKVALHDQFNDTSGGGFMGEGNVDFLGPRLYGQAAAAKSRADLLNGKDLATALHVGLDNNLTSNDAFLDQLPGGVAAWAEQFSTRPLAQVARGLAQTTAGFLESGSALTQEGQDAVDIVTPGALANRYENSLEGNAPIADLITSGIESSITVLLPGGLAKLGGRAMLSTKVGRAGAMANTMDAGVGAAAPGFLSGRATTAAVAENAGYGTMFATAVGQSYAATAQEADAVEATDPAKAARLRRWNGLTSLAKGAIEMGTEKIFPGETALLRGQRMSLGSLAMMPFQEAVEEGIGALGQNAISLTTGQTMEDPVEAARGGFFGAAPFVAAAALAGRFSPQPAAPADDTAPPADPGPGPDASLFPPANANPPDFSEAQPPSLLTGIAQRGGRVDPTIQDSSVVQVPTRGRSTAYGYANDETPDRNSSDGIGAWVSTAEAARIRAGLPSELRLRPGDLAVSRDIEAQFREQGIRPGDPVTLNYADGTTHTGRWMDRTDGSLDGRFDLYSPDGPPANDGSRITGFTPGGTPGASPLSTLNPQLSPPPIPSTPEELEDGSPNLHPDGVTPDEVLAFQEAQDNYRAANPETATQPEPLRTLAAQLDLVRQGSKPSMIFEGVTRDQLPATMRPIAGRDSTIDGVQTPGGYVVFNKAAIRPLVGLRAADPYTSVQAAARTAFQNPATAGQLLGYGTASKPANPTSGLVARAEDGTEIVAVVNDDNDPATTGQIETAINRAVAPRRALSVSAAAFRGSPLAEFVIQSGGIMSRSTARQSGMYRRSPGLWNDAPDRLADPTHNVIYGTTRPDEMAEAAVRAGLLPQGSTQRELWEALGNESSAARSIARAQRQVETDMANLERMARREDLDFTLALRAKSRRDEQRQASRQTAPPVSMAEPLPDPTDDPDYVPFARPSAPAMQFARAGQAPAPAQPSPAHTALTRNLTEDGYGVTVDTDPLEGGKVRSIAKLFHRLHNAAQRIDWAANWRGSKKEFSPGQEAKYLRDVARAGQRTLEVLRVAHEMFPKFQSWYETRIKMALDIFEELDPQAAKPENNFVLRVLLAVTSNGNKVKEQTEDTWKVYQAWKTTGKLAGTKVRGTRDGAINNTLQRMDDIIAVFGWAKVDELLAKSGTVKELRAELVQSFGFTQEEAVDITDGELIDEVVPFALIFGAKLGSFYNNLSGNFDTTTMDRWFMRTFGRAMGMQLKVVDKADVAKKRARLTKALAAASQDAGSLKVLKAAGVRGTAPASQKTTVALAKYFEKKANREGLNKISDELRKATNDLYKVEDGFSLMEAPESGGHRRFIRLAMEQARVEFSAETGKQWNAAELQALLWYFEKSVHELYGSKQQDANPDYGSAANDLYRGLRGADSGAFRPSDAVNGRNIKGQGMGIMAGPNGRPDSPAGPANPAGVNPARPAPAPVTRGVSPKAAEQALSLIRQSLPAVADATRIVTNREALADEIGDYRPQDWADMGPGGVQAFYDPRTGQTTIFLENIEVREGETPMRAVARIILHERIAHAGLAVLRESDPAFARQWQQLTGQIPQDQLQAIAERYPELSGNLDALAEEWLASQVEARAGQLLPSNSLAGKMWAALKAALARVFGKFSRSQPLDAEVDRMIYIARNALKTQFVPPGPGPTLEAMARLHFLRAYHGTPYEVDKFMLQYIGTGEGAQAFGWGLYFAENQSTAEDYRRKLSNGEYVPFASIKEYFKPGNIVNGYSGSDRVISFMEGDDKIPWSVTVERVVQRNGEWVATDRPRQHATTPSVRNVKAAGLKTEVDGNLYTVEILPDESDFLDWDKPLSEQSEKVKQAVRAATISIWKNDVGAVQGSLIYEALGLDLNGGRDGSAAARKASEALLKQGIPGIKYLDGPSRRRGSGTSNFVIFDEDLVKILEVNGEVKMARPRMNFARPGQRSTVRYAGTGPYRVQNQGWRATLTGNALPKEFTGLLNQGKNETAALQQAAALIGQDLNVAIATHAKTHGLTEVDVLTLVDDAMANPTTLYAMQDRALREATRKARNFLDDMSEAVATITGGQLGSAIMANRGNWMRRSYAAFDPAAGWNYDAVEKAAKANQSIAGQPAAKILQDARDFLLTEDPARTPGQIEAILRSLMDRTNWERALTGQGVSKPTESLMRRKELPAALRAVMGEERNPLKRYTLSAGFQAAFIARHEQQERMAQIGLQMGIFSTAREGVYTEEISDGAPTAQGQRRSGLAGLYTTPEMKAALSRAQGTTPDNLIYKAGDLIKFLSGEAKLNKVALSPDSYMVNLIGNVIGLVQTGDLFTLSAFGRMAEAIKVMNSGRPLAALGTAQAVLQETRRAHLARITAAGVADSSYSMADLQSSLDNKLLQFIEADNLWNRASGGVRGAVLGQGLGRIFGGTGRAIGAVTGAAVGTALGGKRIVDAQKQIAQWTLGAPDRFGKILAFQNNYAAHLASGMSDQAAFDLATEKTLDTMPDYSKLPELFKQLSQLGVMGSFIGFQVEVYRNAYHNFRYAAKELASGKPALMALGARRLIGASTVQALALGGFQAIIAGIFGQGASDDEDEAYRRSLAKPYEKFGRLAYTALDGEKAAYFNTSYLLPQVTMWEITRAAFSGDSFETAIENALVAGKNQIAGGGVHTDPLLEALMNARKDGRPVSTETGYRQGAERIVYYLRRALEPGAIDKLDRTARAMDGRDRNSRTFTLEEEGLRLLGVRQTTYKHTETIKSRLYELDGAYTAAAATARTSWKDNAPGERAAAITRANTRIANIRADYEQFTRDLSTLRLLPLLQTVNDNRSADGTRRPILPKEFKPLVDTPDGPKPMSSK